MALFYGVDLCSFIDYFYISCFLLINLERLTWELALLKVGAIVNVLFGHHVITPFD